MKYLAATDLALTIFFLIFLAVFVLIGLIPFFQEISAALQKYLTTPSAEVEGGREAVSRAEEVDSFGAGNEAPAIYDLEIMALRAMARAGRKGLRPKALASDLHLAPPTVKKSLESLRAKGLARHVRAFMVGGRYCLSGRGRAYAAKVGFLPGRLRR